MREKEHYREQLALINERYPGKVMLTVTEVSEVLGICPRTVKAMIERKRNPLAAQNIGTGNKQKIYIIPKTAVASFSAGGLK
jgi:hypothetical protein